MKQPEGFKIMTYQCEKCGNEERIWNSRDAVTPFIVGCAREGCQGLAQHVRWNEDVYAPDHVPKKGERFFTDLTIEKARAQSAKFVEQHWNHEPIVGGKTYPSMKDSGVYESKEDAIEELAQDDMDRFAPHTPTLEIQQ